MANIDVNNAISYIQERIAEVNSIKISEIEMKFKVLFGNADLLEVIRQQAETLPIANLDFIIAEANFEMQLKLGAIQIKGFGDLAKSVYIDYLSKYANDLYLLNTIARYRTDRQHWIKRRAENISNAHDYTLSAALYLQEVENKPRFRVGTSITLPDSDVFLKE